jgi:hypothetical protein
MPEVVEIPAQRVEIMLYDSLEDTVRKRQFLQDQSYFTPIE